jgi:hypothetical protein
MDEDTEDRKMTAGFSSRSMARTKVSLAPIALGALLGAAVLAGGMIGAVATVGLGASTANGHIAQANTVGASLESQALIQLRAGERESAARDAETAAGLVSQALIRVRAGERESAAKAVAPRVLDHVGLTERLFPIVVRHVVAHGPLAD